MSTVHHPISIGGILFLLVCGAVSCTMGRKTGPASGQKETSVLPENHPGRDLARTHCSTCHPVPEPDQLPRDTWPFVLDWMGNYLGYPRMEGRLETLVSRERIPEDSVVSPQELETLRDFFLSEAPDGPLRPADKPPRQQRSDLFEPVNRNILPPKLSYGRNEVVTMVDVDRRAPRLFVGYGNDNLLLEYEVGRGTEDELEFRVVGALKFNTQVVGIETHEDAHYVTLIGHLMRGENSGQVVRLRRQNGRMQATPLVQDYYRTAHAHLHDLNGSGRKDILVSGFGDFDKGRLAWFENVGGNQYNEQVLLDEDGALKTAVHDFSGNGRPDIMALIAQERQELLLYVNEGGGEFTKVQLLRKFPGFGFNRFELADFNRDGLMDIVLINGNNMEIPDPPLRDYHGVRVLLNRGELEFDEAYFYPMYGAIDASVADFTGNGLLDIAAISFYPDWAASPPETFVFLEQTDPMEFAPSILPKTQGSRWLSIDAGDVTGNGRVDLVLGGAGLTHGIPEDFHERFLERFNDLPPVLILENTGQNGSG